MRASWHPQKIRRTQSRDGRQVKPMRASCPGTAMLFCPAGRVVVPSMSTVANALQDQEEVVAFLGRAESYGLKGEKIERHETHASIVFLAGERAYKLKRAVKYPYLDYSTPDKRRAMCEAELAINRRTAPKLYLEVRPIVQDARGLRFGSRDEHAQAVDWVLVRRRFAQGDVLENLRRAGRLTRDLVLPLAETIAAFHDRAERIFTFGGESGMARVIEENAQILGRQPFARNKVDALCAKSKAWLGRVGPLLEQRRRDGFVRRCHGDLHLNNICLLEGVPTPIDAIEFNDDIACIDVWFDLAFLLMDLDRHGLRGPANALFNRYLEKTFDSGGLTALPLFLSCRAAIRAHVAMSARELGTGGQESEAAVLLDRAIEYLSPPPPRLVAVGGLSGTGKSTLAYALAPLFGGAPGAVVLRSDILRRRIMGAEEHVRLSPSAYTSDVNAKVYGEMTRIAGHLLDAGCAVIADAVHGARAERDAIAAVARAHGVPFDGVWLRAPAEILESRVGKRTKDASDADVGVLRRQIATIADRKSVG